MTNASPASSLTSPAIDGEPDPSTPAVAVATRKRGDTPNVEADVFPGTRWAGRRDSSRQYTARVTIGPHDGAGGALDTSIKRRVGVCVQATGHAPRNTRPLVKTFLLEFGRLPDEKQDPAVLAAEKAAKAPQPVVEVGCYLTGGTEYPNGVFLVVEDTSGGAGIAFRVVHQGPLEIFVPDEVCTADQIRSKWPNISKDRPASLLHVDSSDIPIVLRISKPQAPPPAEVHQIRQGGAAPITRIIISQGATPGLLTVKAGWPSTVNDPSWSAQLTPSQIEAAWPKVTRVADPLNGVSDPLVDPTIVMPTFAAALAEPSAMRETIPGLSIDTSATVEDALFDAILNAVRQHDGHPAQNIVARVCGDRGLESITDATYVYSRGDALIARGAMHTRFEAEATRWYIGPTPVLATISRHVKQWDAHTDLRCDWPGKGLSVFAPDDATLIRNIADACGVPVVDPSAPEAFSFASASVDDIITKMVESGDLGNNTVRRGELILKLLDDTYVSDKIRTQCRSATSDLATLYGVIVPTLTVQQVIRVIVLRQLGLWAESHPAGIVL